MLVRFSLLHNLIDKDKAQGRLVKLLRYLSCRVKIWCRQRMMKTVLVLIGTKKLFLPFVGEGFPTDKT